MGEISAGDTEHRQSELFSTSQSKVISVGQNPVNLPVYEELLNRDPRWALNEGSRHFEENSAVFKTLRNIAKRLNGLGIPYAVVGGMALFRHGFRRFTEDVDILVTNDSLRRIHDSLDGLGYVPPFEKSKNLRDTQFGVKIEFLITGQYPGDGKEKPVSFPDPSSANIELNGIYYINLPKLIELKIASGMTGIQRFGDLSDVLKLIKTLEIPVDFSDQLNPYVRDKFKELWRQARTRFIRKLNKKSLAEKASPNSLDVYLDQMNKDGVTISYNVAGGDDVQLETLDAIIAKKYGLVDESEYWEDRENVDDSTAERPNGA